MRNVCLFREKQTEAAGVVSKSEIVEVEGAYCCAKHVMKVISSGNFVLLPTSVVLTWKLKCHRI